MNRKRLLVDVLGFSSLVPFFMFYNYVESIRDDYMAVLLPVAAYLPVAAAWHYFYNKYSDQI